MLGESSKAGRREEWEREEWERRRVGSSDTQPFVLTADTQPSVLITPFRRQTREMSLIKKLSTHVCRMHTP